MTTRNPGTRDSSAPLNVATDRTRRRYDRLAPFYDLMERGMESSRFQQWRERLWSEVEGHRILEIGVGTGKNLPYYPVGSHVTAVDISPRMLERAKSVASQRGTLATLEVADAQALPYPDASFDTVIATFVFCSVPAPVTGLQEAFRVLRPGGQLLMLEHVLSNNPVLRPIMRTLNPLVVWMMGANINRDTVGNVEQSGFELDQVDDLKSDIVKGITAHKPS